MQKIRRQKTLKHDPILSREKCAGLLVFLIITLSLLALAEYNDCFWMDNLAKNSSEIIQYDGHREPVNHTSGGTHIYPDRVTSKDIILDVSENSDSYIQGAIHINYKKFLDDGFAPKSVPEIAKILGNAGISRNDSVAIYGKCLPCGGGPSVATYVYWIMSSIGHKKVKLLAGGIDAWKLAGKPIQVQPSIRPGTEYNSIRDAEFFAAYDYVKSGNIQIIDARPASEFKLGSIPGAINMPYETILNGDAIKNIDELEKIFGGLRKDEPVVVYTNTGIKASVLWFALEMLGYDAKLYSWADWRLHEKKKANGNSTLRSSDIL
jgi:thiosulfate/3-mercaptopyruvate sulfurtransferase